MRRIGKCFNSDAFDSNPTCVGVLKLSQSARPAVASISNKKPKNS